MPQACARVYATLQFPFWDIRYIPYVGSSSLYGKFLVYKTVVLTTGFCCMYNYSLRVNVIRSPYTTDNFGKFKLNSLNLGPFLLLNPVAPSTTFPSFQTNSDPFFCLSKTVSLVQEKWIHFLRLTLTFIIIESFSVSSLKIYFMPSGKPGWIPLVRTHTFRHLYCFNYYFIFLQTILDTISHREMLIILWSANICCKRSLLIHAVWFIRNTYKKHSL